MVPKAIWSALDHKIWKDRERWPKFQRILVALSGGVDSVVMLTVFDRLSKAGQFELCAAYIHHGVGANQEWRTQAQKQCRDFCEQLGVRFVVGGPSSVELVSEADLRRFRYQELTRLKQELQCDFIQTAHHADDVIETRLLRLLRGTGPSGLEALREIDGDRWRPFLRVNKQELFEYANENQLKFTDDPSNASEDPTRNWVRKSLLPFIEARQTGMVESLGRSLQLLVEALEKNDEVSFVPCRDGGLGFSRVDYLALSRSQQCHWVAQMFLELGVKDYSQGQIEEIRKRLDNSQKVHTFTVGSVYWVVDAKQVQAKQRA